jgi:hypothetical protein
MTGSGAGEADALGSRSRSTPAKTIIGVSRRRREKGAQSSCTFRRPELAKNANKPRELKAMASVFLLLSPH